MWSSRTGVERRQHRRGALPVAAVLFRKQKAIGRFDVCDLSAGGVMLTGRREVAPDEPVRVLLPLPGREPLVIEGRVVRTSRGPNQTNTLAIRFLSTVGTRATIQDALDAPPGRCAPPEASAVLVVMDEGHSRDHLVDRIARVGRRALAAPTPLDAVRLLEDLRANIDAVVVDMRVGDLDGVDLMTYLEEEHPGVRRVLLRGELRPSAVGLMQASTFVHAFVADPSDEDALRAALVP